MSSSSQLKDIYKFYYDYFKLYKESSTSLVEKWSKTDMENALKWSESCQELICKLEKSTKKTDFIKNFLKELTKITSHFKLDDNENDIEDLIKNAPKHMKKTLLYNKYFNQELKCILLEFKLNEIKNQNSSLDCQNLSNHCDNLLDKICLKLCSKDYDITLIDSLLEFTIIKQNNLEFVIELFKKIKRIDETLFEMIVVRLLNKRYEFLLANNQSINFFKLFEDSDRLIKAFFCYLLFTYDEICDYLDKNSLDINDPNNCRKSDFYDLNLIVENLEMAIKMLNKNEFILILQHLNSKQIANKNKSTCKWYFLINKLKLKHIKEDDFQLPNEFLLDDNE